MKKRYYQSYKRIINFRVYKFDKGCGFAIGTGDTAKEKIEEQLGKATKAEIDPQQMGSHKIQKKFANVEKK